MQRVLADTSILNRANQVRRSLPGAYVGLALLGALVQAFSPDSAQAQKTFLIEENIDFDGSGGCPILNSFTPDEALGWGLKDALLAANWTGNFYCDAACSGGSSNAWPQDFWEQCSSNYGSGGLDGSYGDNRLLSVYSGHGWPGGFQYGTNHNGQCWVDFATNMRLGTMSGSKAAYLMLLTSRGAKDPYAIASTQWLRQAFGWMNSPGIYTWMPPSFFSATGSSTNADAWLSVGSAFGNSPRAISFVSTNSNDCWGLHGSAKLKAGTWLTPRGGGPGCNQGQFWTYYCHTQIDNCGNNC